MPAYNAEMYIAEAIRSVVAQDYPHWELLIINDGSTDSTEGIARSFSDSRIRYFSQSNLGVSAARNQGLANRKGEFFCFLDADDCMPVNSLSSRMALFETHENIRFVDGVVEKWNEDFTTKRAEWHPTYQGPPLADLLHLTGQSFFGLTWMVRMDSERRVYMRQGITHGEDLLFYMELARQFPDDRYTHTQEVVLHYRQHPQSAMQNLEGLDGGYRQLAAEIGRWPEVTEEVKKKFYLKTRSIMFKSFLRHFQPIQAFQALR